MWFYKIPVLFRLEAQQCPNVVVASVKPEATGKHSTPMVCCWDVYFQFLSTCSDALAQKNIAFSLVVQFCSRSHGACPRHELMPFNFGIDVIVTN